MVAASFSSVPAPTPAAKAPATAATAPAAVTPAWETANTLPTRAVSLITAAVPPPVTVSTKAAPPATLAAADPAFSADLASMLNNPLLPISARLFAPAAAAAPSSPPTDPPWYGAIGFAPLPGFAPTLMGVLKPWSKLGMLVTEPGRFVRLSTAARAGLIGVAGVPEPPPIRVLMASAWLTVPMTPLTVVCRSSAVLGMNPEPGVSTPGRTGEGPSKP